MDLDKIKTFFQRCSIEQLRELKECLNAQIIKIETKASIEDNFAAKDLRTESRFELKTNGFLRRLTNVKQNEKTEYSVTIKDISKSGMCLIVSPSFIYSNAVEVTFQGPNGKMKQCLVEIVRMKRNIVKDKASLELGCRSITKEHLNMMLIQDRKIDQLNNRLQNREGITVIIVAQQQTDTQYLTKVIRTIGHPIEIVQTVQQAICLSQNDNDTLAILLNGHELCQDVQQMTALIDKPRRMATLAVIEDEIHRLDFLKVGVDECLIAESLNKFLFRAIDRALFGNALRKGHKITQENNDVLIYAENPIMMNMAKFHLEELQIQSKTIFAVDELYGVSVESFDLAFIEFDPMQEQQFQQITAKLSDMPIIAMCEHIGYGTMALAQNAREYITMPLNTKQVKNVLQYAAPHLLGPDAASKDSQAIA